MVCPGSYCTIVGQQGRCTNGSFSFIRVSKSSVLKVTSYSFHVTACNALTDRCFSGRLRVQPGRSLRRPAKPAVQRLAVEDDSPAGILHVAPPPEEAHAFRYHRAGRAHELGQRGVSKWRHLNGAVPGHGSEALGEINQTAGETIRHRFERITLYPVLEPRRPLNHHLKQRESEPWVSGSVFLDLGGGPFHHLDRSHGGGPFGSAANKG